MLAFLRWLQIAYPTFVRYGGLAGVFYEAVFEKFDRPYLLAVFGAMMGLSEIVRAMQPPGLMPSPPSMPPVIETKPQSLPIPPRAE